MTDEKTVTIPLMLLQATIQVIELGKWTVSLAEMQQILSLRQELAERFQGALREQQ